MDKHTIIVSIESSVSTMVMTEYLASIGIDVRAYCKEFHGMIHILMEMEDYTFVTLKYGKNLKDLIIDAFEWSMDKPYTNEERLYNE